MYFCMYYIVRFEDVHCISIDESPFAFDEIARKTSTGVDLRITDILRLDVIIFEGPFKVEDSIFCVERSVFST
jgi:hypothetical protein